MYDRSAYCEKNQIVSRNQTGCGGSYIPYGSNTSLRSALLSMELLKQAEDGRISESSLLSEKGTGYYFKQAGLKTSVVYDAQTVIIDEKKLDDYGAKCRSCEWSDYCRRTA